jgi:hypothetical protein
MLEESVQACDQLVVNDVFAVSGVSTALICPLTAVDAMTTCGHYRGMAHGVSSAMDAAPSMPREARQRRQPTLRIVYDEDTIDHAAFD